jgi:hypothetical protein
MYDYDDIDRIAARFDQEVKACEGKILRGNFDEIIGYKVECAELRTWRRAHEMLVEAKRKLKKEL